MDNEAPRYAEWIPTAGGYVADGKVVSKSPQYDANGKLQLSVDTSVFGNTTPQNSAAPKAEPKVANTLLGNVGVAAANIQGSGTDANSLTTSLGSMASLADNKAGAQDSVLSTPVSKSPLGGQPILSVEDQALKDIQDGKARNDYQAMINGYLALERATGVDYTPTIQDLTRQRQQKIQSVDDIYLQRLNAAQQNANNALSTASLTGEEQDVLAYQQAQNDYNNILAEQANWRNSVGYEDAMRQKYQLDLEELDFEYQTTYMDSVRDISNQLVQMLPGILNFQYNPYADTSLQIAQQYATSRVKEQMNATGMYYSSMTQSAVAKAVAELVPVYQKMAREEAVENFQLLQNTASFLVNLEQSQFALWKGQVDLKLAANAEKRAKIDQAIQNANARGYYTNEEAALLGIAPGTESQAARDRALDKQEQIEKEIRQLEQSEALAKFNSDLQAEKMLLENELNKEYYAYQVRNPKPSTSGSSGSGSSGTSKFDGLTFTQYRDLMVSQLNNGEITEKEMEDKVDSTTFTPTEKEAIISGAKNKTVANEGGINFNRPLSGSLSKSDLSKLILDYDGDDMTNDYQLIDVLDDLLIQGKDYDSVYSAVANTKVDLGGGVKEPIFDTVLLKQLDGTAQKKLENYYKYYAAIYNASTPETGEIDVPGLKYSIRVADDLDADTQIKFYQRVMDTYNDDGTRK